MREKIRQMFPSADSPRVPGVTKEDPGAEVERVAVFGGKTRLLASSAIKQAARQGGPLHVHLPSHTPSPPHSHGITPPPAVSSPERDQRWEGVPTQVPSYSSYGNLGQPATNPSQPNYPAFDQGPALNAWPTSQIAQPFTEPYHYASSGSGGVDSTDFIFNDSWTAFLQGHGVLPKIS